MTLEEFKAACVAAIAQHHDPKQDGPLLVAVREQTGYSSKKDEWEQPFPEFASAIGEWPRHHHGNDYAQYTQFTSDSIKDLAEYAQELWRTRQPEPDGAYDTEPADPFAGTAWSTGR